MFKKLKRLAYLKFARKLNNAPTVPVPSIISENTKLTGDIISNGIVHVDGRVEGDITCEELVIGLKGAVIGSVNVSNLHLYGLLQGKANVDKLFVAKPPSFWATRLTIRLPLNPALTSTDIASVPARRFRQNSPNRI